MAVRRSRSRSQNRRRTRPSLRNLQIGSTLDFYNVGLRRFERNRPIEDIFTRSNEKGRTITFAYGIGKQGDELYQIISNTKSRSKSSRRRSRSRR